MFIKLTKAIQCLSGPVVGKEHIIINSDKVCYISDNTIVFDHGKIRVEESVEDIIKMIHREEVFYEENLMHNYSSDDDSKRECECS